MIREYHNHKLQTNPWHREEEQHNNHETPGRQTMQGNQLSLFSIKMIEKLECTIYKCSVDISSYSGPSGILASDGERNSV